MADRIIVTQVHTCNACPKAYYDSERNIYCTMFPNYRLVRLYQDMGQEIYPQDWCPLPEAKPCK
jgi:hypothetical protein